jgi:sugar lactone lactonase YvrE
MHRKILLLLGLMPLAADIRAQGIITTIAGGGVFQVTGIGGPATNVPLGGIGGVAADTQGNVYAVDRTNYIVVKVAPTGVLTIVAGNGTSNFTTNGDGGLATNASFQHPNAIAVDTSGNIFLTDGPRVRKVTPQGIITTVAGSGKLPLTGYSGDGGPATQASLQFPTGVATDASGNLYIADSGLILKVNAQGIISTVANIAGGINGLASAPNGVLYVTNTWQAFSAGLDGTVKAIAGSSNTDGYSGDGGPATAALLNDPTGIAVDSAGDLYIADLLNNGIRKITPDGIIHTIAGSGVANFTGDQGQASLATVNEPTGIAVDLTGNVYFGDSINYRVRRIDPSGTITTYAGNGNWGFVGEGSQARGAVLSNPSRVLVDPSGNVYFSDTGNKRVRKVAPNGVISTVAGLGAIGFAGDGGPGTRALLAFPTGLALDSSGNLYIADGTRVRRVDTSGIITTFAGNGGPATSDSGDGGPAIDASIAATDIAFDAAQNLYILDGNFGIRRVSPDGTIFTFATFRLSNPSAIAVDASGNLYVSVPTPISLGGPGPPTTASGQLVRISPDGTTTSIVGNFSNPGKIAMDSQGELYVPDGNTVTRLSPSGTVTLVAGTGPAGFSGDDGPANAAQLSNAKGVALDSAGNLYIADSGNNRIRKVFLNPASGIFQPTLQINLQPGYYTAAVALGQGEHPGYWGMQVLAPVGVLAGGFNLGGTIQQRSAPPGFGGIYVPSPQTLHVHVDAQTNDGSSSAAVGLGVQILDASRNPINAEQFGGTSLDYTQPLAAGYYTIVVRGGVNSPNENFQMALGATQFAGGVVIGGFAAPTNSTGFGGFDLTAPQQVTIQVFGQPTYGADGAGGLRLTLYDANRNVIATAP